MIKYNPAFIEDVHNLLIIITNVWIARIYFRVKGGYDLYIYIYIYIYQIT